MQTDSADPNPASKSFRSLNRRLLGLVLVFSLLFTAVTVSVRLYFAYEEEQATLSQQLDATMGSMANGLARAVWDVDTDQIESLVKDLSATPGISGVKLTTTVGKIYEKQASGGKFAGQKKAARTVDLRVEESKGSLGTLSLYADQANLAQRMRNITLEVLATQLLQVAALSLLLLYIGSRLLTRHIQHLAQHLQSLTPETLQQTFALHRAPRRHRDELDELVQRVNSLQNQLVQHQSGLSNQVAAILTALQGVRDYDTLSSTFFSSVAPLLNLGQGSFYRAHAEQRKLILCGTYARSSPSNPEQDIAFGEGLVGQCAVEQRTLLIAAPPPGYLEIQSGLGSSAPACIVLLPVINESTLLGVIELACLRPFSAQDESLMQRLMPVIALSLEVIAHDQRTQQLLDATQEQALALDSQRGEIKALLDEQQAIFENAPLGILYTAQGHIIRANKRIAAQLGREMSELVGQPGSILHPSAQMHQEFNALAGALLGAGKDVYLERRIAKKDGSEFYAAISGCAVTMVGYERAAVWMFEDISERKRLEHEMQASEERMRQILENSPAGVSINTEAGKNVFSNRRVSELLGIAPQDVGKHPTAHYWRHAVDRDKFVAQLRRDGVVVDYQADFVKTDGAPLTVLISSQRMLIAGQYQLVSWLYDITERKQAELAIQNERALLHRILDTSPIGVAITVGGVARMANPAVQRMMGLQVGKSAPNAYVNPEDRAQLMSKLQSEGTVHDMEIQMYNPAGEVREILTTYMLTDYQGERGVLGWAIDITERKATERQILQASEEQTAMFESATLGIAFLKDRTILRCNSRLAELFARSVEALQGQTTRNWYLDEAAYLRGGDSVYQDLALGKTHQREQQLVRADGSLFWSRLSGRAVDSTDLSRGSVWMIEDITERRNREAEIKRINFLTDVALELTGSGYWVVDYSDPEYYFQSERAAAILGEINKADGRYHLQTEWFDRLLEANPVTAELAAQRYHGAIDGKYEKYEVTYAYKRPLDGRIVWINAGGKLVRDDQGKALFMYGAYQDVTALKTSEQAILNNQRQMRTLVDSIGSIISMKNLQSRYQLINAAGVKEIGHPEQDILGKSPHDFLPKDVADKMVGIEKQAMESGKAITYQESIPTSDGSPMRHFLTTKTPLLNERGEVYGICAIATNITERVQADAELAEHMKELELFNRLTVDREQKMIELKSEINTLLQTVGQAAKYRIVE